MILAIGEPEQRSIIDSGSKRTDVSAFLGEPIERASVDPPLTANELIQQQKGPPMYVRGLSDRSLATTIDTYRYTGWVQNNTDVGEAVAMAGYTFFLSELVMVPLAIKMQLERVNATHLVKVWYDSTEGVVAYEWRTEK
jgi:hypothetical protein